MFNFMLHFYGEKHYNVLPIFDMFLLFYTLETSPLNETRPTQQHLPSSQLNGSFQSLSKMLHDQSCGLLQNAF
jgi:hypothetical protein